LVGERTARASARGSGALEKQYTWRMGRGPSGSSSRRVNASVNP